MYLTKTNYFKAQQHPKNLKRRGVYPLNVLSLTRSLTRLHLDLINSEFDVARTQKKKKLHKNLNKYLKKN